MALVSRHPRSLVYARLYQHKHRPPLREEGLPRHEHDHPQGPRFTMTEDRTATEADVVTKLSRGSVAGTVARLTD